MSERVERERNGGGRLNGMILVSLMFHGGVLSLLFFTPSFPSPKLTFGPVYTVSLVNFSGNVLEQKSGTAAAKELLGASRSETVLKKRLEPEPVIPIRSLESRKKQDQALEKAMEEIRKRAASTTVLKKSLEPEPVIPIRSLESRKKQDQALEKAMEEIRKRAAATAATPESQAKATQDAKATPQAKAGPASSPSPGDAEMDAKMRAYYAMIWSRVKGGWALPQGILPGEVLGTVINVTILRSGAVTGINFEKRSGNRYFDESAMKAIRKATPFPPLPAWISEGSLNVGIRFHSSELRS